VKNKRECPLFFHRLFPKISFFPQNHGSGVRHPAPPVLQNPKH